MKKAMMIAATLLVAVMTQAAQVSWQVGYGIPVNSQNGGTPTSASETGNIYVFLLGAAPADTTFANGDFNRVTGQLNVNGTWTSAQGTGGGWTVAGAWQAGVSTTSAGQIQVFRTIENADAAAMNIYYAIVAIDDATTGFYGVDVFSVTGLGGAVTTFERTLTGSFDVGQFTTVPEPTSMALLALGAAALGLRRKFRK